MQSQVVDIHNSLVKFYLHCKMTERVAGNKCQVDSN